MKGAEGLINHFPPYAQRSKKRGGGKESHFQRAAKGKRYAAPETEKGAV